MLSPRDKHCEDILSFLELCYKQKIEESINRGSQEYIIIQLITMDVDMNKFFSRANKNVTQKNRFKLKLLSLPRNEVLARR